MRTITATVIIAIVVLIATSFIIDLASDPFASIHEKTITVSDIRVAEDNITLTLTDTTGERFTYDLVSDSETLYRQGYACHTGTCGLMATGPAQGEEYYILYDSRNRILYIDQKD